MTLAPCGCGRFTECSECAALRDTARALDFSHAATAEWLTHRRAALAALPASAPQEPPTPPQRPAVAPSATPAPSRARTCLSCKRGHPRTQENTERHRRGAECAECRRERQRAAYRERLEEERARGLGEGPR